MPSRHKDTNRNETFGRLLSGAINSIATYEGRTTLTIEEELGQLIGISGKTIQRYKAGYLPREDRTIQLLAEAAIRRGYLSREWLRRFLYVARYPFADRLIDRLCPSGPAQPPRPHIYENLPAPTYRQFVMRPQAFIEVLDGLQRRSAAVLIVGLGGNGKTSLAREVAAWCLKDSQDGPHFDAVVWASDKDRPGTTNLSSVLDEVARTLDYPGFVQLAHDEKRREVEQLLKRQRVLVIVDNFETITDGALLSWLLRLPEPSKAIVTTREYRREFRRGGWPVDLRGMTGDEARALMNERMRVLKIEKQISDLAQLEPLVAATGGTPKAIELALGLIKYEHRPLYQVVDDLHAARGELFDDLFARCWELLDAAAQWVLLAMPLFPDSASAEALQAIADVQAFAFDRAVECLADLALLDVQQTDLTSAPSYTLHPLVRSFARAKLGEQPEFVEEARERWVAWYIQLVSKVGFCWNDLSRLEPLDSEQETIHAVVAWTFEKQRYIETLQMAKGVSFYFYVRGPSDITLSINLMRIEAARNLGDTIEEIEAIVHRVQVLGKQGNHMDAEQYLPRLREIVDIVQLPDEIVFELQHAQALYLMARQEVDAAQQMWRGIMNLGKKLSVRPYIVARGWLAVCLYQKREITAAQQLFREALQDAIAHNHQRAITFDQFRLAAIDLDLGNLEDAEQALAECHQRAYQYQDRESMAHIQRLCARLHVLHHDIPAARKALIEAIDLFKRLAKHHELIEAREELARLAVTGAA